MSTIKLNYKYLEIVKLLILKYSQRFFQYQTSILKKISEKMRKTMTLTEKLNVVFRSYFNYIEKSVREDNPTFSFKVAVYRLEEMESTSHNDLFVKCNFKLRYSIIFLKNS